MNLTDMIMTAYFQKLTDNSLLIKKKVWFIIIRLFLNKMLKKIKIINDFLKIIKKLIMKMIIWLAQCCQTWKYFSEIFKIIQMMIFCKFDKINYQKLNSWKLITLLKIINKIIKIIMTQKLCFMIEKHDMLSSQQIRAW